MFTPGEDTARLRSDLEEPIQRLRDAVEEQRVQLTAHAQVFQGTQASVVAQAHSLSQLQGETSDATRRAESERLALGLRIDQVRTDLSERATQGFTDATQHCDRLISRMQQDVLRLEGSVSQCAQTTALTDATSSLDDELRRANTSLEDVRREIRTLADQLSETREKQNTFSLQSTVSGLQASNTQRFTSMEETIGRLDTAFQSSSAAALERNTQRQNLFESRQLKMERDAKQLELAQQRLSEDLASRPLRTDVISALAQQELLIEACAKRDAVEALEERVGACAELAALQTVQGEVETLREQTSASSTLLAELKQTAADKAMLLQRGRDIDALRTKVEEKISRAECSTMLVSKSDRTETRQLLQAHEQLQASLVAAQAHVQKVDDTLTHSSTHKDEWSQTLKQMSNRIDKLQLATSLGESQNNARKSEVSSAVKVLRLLLDDAEMRCALDETDSAALPADGVPLSPVPTGAGLNSAAANGVPPLRIKSYGRNGASSLPASGGLQPLSPKGDKVWFRSALLPRGEVLAQRRRLLVGARHSWIGDTCLARSDESGPQQLAGTASSGWGPAQSATATPR